MLGTADDVNCAAKLFRGTTKTKMITSKPGTGSYTNHNFQFWFAAMVFTKFGTLTNEHHLK